MVTTYISLLNKPVNEVTVTWLYNKMLQDASVKKVILNCKNVLSCVFMLKVKAGLYIPRTSRMFERVTVCI